MFLAVAFAAAVGLLFHSHSNRLIGLAFIAAAASLVLLFEKTFPSVNADLRRPRPWWQTRLGGAVFILGLGVVISILSSRIATLWFSLIIVSAVLVALFVRAIDKDAEPLGVMPNTPVDGGNHSDGSERRTNSQSDSPKPTRRKKFEEKLDRTKTMHKPPISIPDNYAIGVRDLAASVEWYAQTLELRERHDDREDDSGRAFSDLGISGGETFLTLIESRSGEQADSQHVIFYAKHLEKAHDWLAKHGVLVEPITTVSGGNRFFRFHDLDGNAIEVCVEPG